MKEGVIKNWAKRIFCRELHPNVGTKEKYDEHMAKVRKEISDAIKNAPPIPMWRNNMCKCIHPDHMDHIVADRVHERVALLELCTSRDYMVTSFEYCHGYPNHNQYYATILIDGHEISVSASASKLYEKKACLACGTCCGWKVAGGDEDPWKMFDRIINSKLESIGINEERERLAKEICNVQ